MGNTGAMHSQMQVSEITGVSVSCTTTNIHYTDRFFAILAFGIFWGPFQSESRPSNSPFAIQSAVPSFSQDDFDTFDSLGFTDSACGTCTGGKKVSTTPTTPQLFAGFASSKKNGRLLSLVRI